MFTKLTPQQKALIPIIRDKWIKKAITPTNREHSIIQKNIQWLYGQAKLSPVPVIVCEDLDCFGSQIKKFIEKTSVSSSVGSSVKSSVGSLVESLVRSSVSLSVWSSVESSVGSSAGSSVRSSVSSSVRSSVGLYLWADDIACYDFWKEAGILTDKDIIDKVEKYIDVLSDCSYGFLTDKIAIVLTKPEVQTDSEWRLHSTTNKALKWRNGDGEYFLHGVKFEKELWEEIVSGKMLIKDILQLNTEQSRAAMATISEDRFMRELKPKLLNRNDRGDELFEIEGKEVGLDNSVRLARYYDWSTKRVYLKWAKKEWGDTIDEVLAAKHKMSIERWLNALHA